MRRLIIIFLFLQIFGACNNAKEEIAASENDVDAARNFIQSALSGDYKKAQAYILPDSVNNEYLDAFERNYNSRMNAEE